MHLYSRVHKVNEIPPSLVSINYKYIPQIQQLELVVEV